jgi:VanZ family protein
MSRVASDHRPGRYDGTRPPRARRAWLALLGLSLLLQLVVLYAPSAPGGPEVNGLDKVVHAGVFGAVVLTALLAGLPRRWVLAVLALHAPVSEVVQATLLPSRDGDVWDAVADLTGVGLALGAFLVIARRRRW